MAQVFDMLLTKPEKFSGYAEKARSIRDMRHGMGRPNFNDEGIEISQSTHLMRHEIGEAIGAEPGKWYAFPMLFPHKKNIGEWIDYGDDAPGAYREALRRGEVFPFGTDKKAAGAFSKGGYKK